ncbi:MAG: TonB-dependent receptor [Cyclobacteriaceae bacterium]
MEKLLRTHSSFVLFFMKVAIIPVIAVVACSGVVLATESRGQEVLERKISLVVKNKKMLIVFGEIEKAAGIRFVYSPQVIPVRDEVSLRANDDTLGDVLEKLLTPYDIVFEAIDNQIVLRKAERSRAGAVDRIITGQITDEKNMALPGVSILIKGTGIGTATDVDGRYSLTVPTEHERGILVISFIGYTTQQIAIGDMSSIDIQMIPDIRELEQVVVVGYGTVKKRDITGSVSSVKGDLIDAYPSGDMMQSLSGRAAGVEIVQNTGAPGAAVSVRIRGTNSIRGDNEPLYVVDGFPLSGQPSNLNNSDIESIEILKDASATAIYGSRGANGVVIITTKTGRAGQPQVDFETSYSVQTLRKKLELMNANEYAQLFNIQAANDNIAPYFTQDQINSFGEGTDWQDVVFSSAPIYRSSLTVNGGSESTRFSIGGSLFQQEGIIQGSDFNRYSLRAKIDHDISDKLTLQLSTILTQSTSGRKDSQSGARGTSMANSAITAPPTAKAYNDDGTINDISTTHPFVAPDILNPLYFIEEESTDVRENVVFANAAFIYEPIRHLSIKISGGIENTDSRTDIFRTREFRNSNGIAEINTRKFTSLLSENTISYSNTFSDLHAVSAVAGYTYQHFLNEGFGARSQGFLSNVFETSNLGAASTPGIPQSSFSEAVILSWLGRVNYSFNDKYLLTASFRADGSSRFSEGNKWGYFPSAAVAWRISQEDFLMDNQFITDLKLRASWGLTGSQAISPYATLNTLSAGNTVFGNSLYVTFAPGTTLPADLKWETTEQIDIGLDLGILDDRVIVSADYFVKNTRDLLNIVRLPSSMGFSQTIQNVGEVQNSGVELSVNAHVVNSGDLNWSLNANTTFLKNKVTRLAGGVDILTNNVSVLILSDNVGILREGRPIGQFFGYVEDGYTDQGRIKYRDLTGDGVVTADDKTSIGDPNPDMIYGFNSNLSYKNFELVLFFQGTVGNDIFNASSASSTLDYGQGLNGPKDVLTDHWTPENPDAKYPKISRQASVEVSDRFVEDGSYLRLKNIQLAYNIPVQEINWIRRFQVYVSGQNLLTSTNYSWWDPEVNTRGLGTNRGIDHFSYPTSKSFTAGIRAGF